MLFILLIKENYVLSESFLHLLLWPIFRQLHPNFINVRTAYASEIWAQLTKNLLTKSSTKRFRENINKYSFSLCSKPPGRGCIHLKQQKSPLHPIGEAKGDCIAVPPLIQPICTTHISSISGHLMEYENLKHILYIF